MSPRALRERLSLPRRVRSRVEKLTSCTRKFNGRLLRKSREFRYSPSDSPFSPPFPLHMRRWYEARKIRYLVGGNLLGTRRRSSRRNFGSSVSFPSRFFVSYPPLDVLPPSLYPSLFPVYRLRELPESRNANLTCTTTNGARRKEFEHVRVWEILSRLTVKCYAAVNPYVFCVWVHMEILYAERLEADYN